MTSDSRDNRHNVCRSIKHFDNYTRPFKLSPHRSMKLDALNGFESTLDEFRINKMIVANGTLYGVGVVSRDDAHTKIYTKSTAADPTSLWTEAYGGTSLGSVENNIGVVLYRNYLYGVGINGLWKYGDITGTPSFTAGDYTAHVPTAPGLVHSKYDIMYWPSGNLILQNDLHTGAGWSVGLTLPKYSNIVSICEHQNYLAIACNQPDGTNVVYLWDTQTSVDDLSEKIDWGNGFMKLIESIGGILCGISTTSGNQNSLNPRVMFKYYSGSRVVLFQEFVCSNAVIGTDKQKYNDLFYFLAEMTIDGVSYKGLWKIFKNPSGEMAVSFDRLPRNDVALNGGSLHSFIRWGDYIFISYNNSEDSDKYTIWRTNDQSIFVATSIYETTINPIEPELSKNGAGTRSALKSLAAAAIGTEPLQSGQRVVLKYRVDGGAWVTFIDMSYDPTNSSKNVVRESTFATNGRQSKKGREYEFRIESTGGAEITEVKYKIEVYETLL